MSVLLSESKRLFRPVRVVAATVVFLFVLCFFMPYSVWNADVQLAADAGTILAERYGTHLDAQERAVIENELFAEMKENIRLRMAACEVFCDAEVKTYEEYSFLRYDKTRLAAMTEEDKNAMSDEHFLLNYGVGKDYVAILSEAEKTLLELSDAQEGEVGEILYDCLVFQRIEDWVTFWYDDRQRLASFAENAETSYEAEALQAYVQTENYYGNMPNEVSEAVGQSFQYVSVVLVFAAYLLCALVPATDRMCRMDLLQCVTKKGKKVLHSQYSAVLLCAFALSVIGVFSVFVFLLAKIPSALWRCPLNSYQSYFTVYCFNGTLGQYFLLLALLLVLLVLVCCLLAFTVSLFAKSYTALLGILLPLSVATEWLANLLFRIPFSVKQSLHGPLYFSDLIPFPMAEIPVCAALCAVAVAVSLIIIQKRKKELSDYT